MADKTKKVKTFKGLDNWLRSMVLQNIETKSFTYKFQYKDYFKSFLPEVFLYPCVLFNLVIMTIASITGSVALDLLIFIPGGLLAIWWSKTRDELKKEVYNKAKEEYKKREEMWISYGLPLESFKLHFPNWEEALDSDFARKSMYFMYSYIKRKQSKEDEEFYSHYKYNYRKSDYENSSKVAKAMKILGISTLQGMTQDKLKNIYRSFVKKYHPDNNPGHTKEFQSISEAYDILRAYV